LIEVWLLMIVPRDGWMGGKILPKHRCWFASQNTVAGWIARALQHELLAHAPQL